MNKNHERLLLQIQNTMEQMQKLGYVLYYNVPKNEETEQNLTITWNNHRGGREVSSKYFLSIEQYLKILSDNAFLAVLNDYSLIRCSFVFKDKKLISENLLWWPCPVKVDSNMVDEFGLIETIQLLLSDIANKEYIRMRSPIRVDFDIFNDTEVHPKAHMHIESEECRINTNEPICFNRFINYIVKSFYPNWNMNFKEYDYLKLQYNNSRETKEYCNKTRVVFE